MITICSYDSLPVGVDFWIELPLNHTCGLNNVATIGNFVKQKDGTIKWNNLVYTQEEIYSIAEKNSIKKEQCLFCYEG